MIKDQELIGKAMEARNNAYAPYSNYKVGAALLAKNGTVYTGCNVENAAFSGTNCAERSAFFKAISEGVKEFEAIAIVGSKEGELNQYAYPCGVCRQVMMEFCNPREFRILVAISINDHLEYRLEELLPYGFGPSNLVNA